MNTLETVHWPFNTDIQTPLFPACSYEERMQFIGENVQQWLDFLDKKE